MNAQTTVFHSPDLEQQVLGAIMLENGLLDRVSDILTVDHFGDPVHARIFGICLRRISKGHLASPVTLATVLADDEGLKQLGGPQYLVRMAAASMSSFAIRDYAKQMVELHMRRALRHSAEEGLQALSEGTDSAEVKLRLQQALHALPEVAGEESSISLLKATTRAVEIANRSYQGAQKFLTLGIPSVDAILRGLAPGDFMLIGGTTSMGKTSLALEAAANISIDQGRPVAFWSLEMSDDQLATRIASARSRIPYSALRSAEDMSEADFRKWIEATQQISQAPMRIVPKHIRDIAAGHAALRRVKREFGNDLSAVFVDYAQLIRGVGKSRYEQMTDVSISLKTIAGMLECPVVALVQLDRSIGDRDNKRPQLSDIKETGQFENDADQVIFCHREEYWLERGGPKPGRDGKISVDAQADWEADLKASRNLMEVLVRKNRHGGLANASVGFHAPTCRFWALEHSTQQEDF